MKEEAMVRRSSRTGVADVVAGESWVGDWGSWASQIAGMAQT